MKFFTLAINLPEEIKPILARWESRLGYGYTYHVIDLDPSVSDIDSVIAEIQNKSCTHWNYIEDEGNE